MCSKCFIKSMTSQRASLVAMFKTKWNVLGFLCVAVLANAQAQNATTTAGRVEQLKLNSLSGYTNHKRESNAQDLAGSATAKSYEPPPEFYRGPGSTAADNAAAGFISKPIGSVLATGLGSGQAGNVGDALSESYSKWRNGAGIHERISVGHYGGGGQTQSNHAGAGYAYEGHPYEYAHGGAGGGGSHYANAGGYYGGSSAESLPFDVYGTRPGLGPAHGHYGGGDYSYSYPLEGHDIATHKGPPELSQKALLAKSFLIPLASAAVLGIAAALVSNPLLLQLGTVSGLGPTVVGKRKRRSLGSFKYQGPYAAYDKKAH